MSTCMPWCLAHYMSTYIPVVQTIRVHVFHKMHLDRNCKSKKQIILLPAGWGRHPTSCTCLNNSQLTCISCILLVHNAFRYSWSADQLIIMIKCIHVYFGILSSVFSLQSRVSICFDLYKVMYLISSTAGREDCRWASSYGGNGTSAAGSVCGGTGGEGKTERTGERVRHRERMISDQYLSPVLIFDCPEFTAVFGLF